MILEKVSNKPIDAKAELFDPVQYIGVLVQNSIPTLTEGVKIHKRSMKGSMSYYHVQVIERQDILITLNIQGSIGDSDLFVNPGKFNFPKLNNSFKNSNSMSDDEVTLTKEDHDLNFPDKTKEVWYTIGVFTFDNCEFDLLTLSSKFKVVKPYSGQLFSLNTSNKSPLVF